MRLKQPFYQFPFRFDARLLRREVEQFAENAWIKHPQSYEGNSALMLISTNGALRDQIAPPVRATAHLAQTPYIRQVLGQFKTVLGQARLMRLESGYGVPLHNDVHYYWRNHTRVHIPIVTHPDVTFHCGEASVHMGEGEAWTFDNWRRHRVENDTPVRRIHLVFDTLGTAAFWAMAKPCGDPAKLEIPFKPGADPRLLFENFVGPPVLSPAELDGAVGAILSDMQDDERNDAQAIGQLQDLVEDFCREWACAWAYRGPTPDGLPLFQRLAHTLRAHVAEMSNDIKLKSNGWPAKPALLAVISASIAATPSQRDKTSRRNPQSPETLEKDQRSQQVNWKQPIFIVSAPRSGSTLLFETMAKHNSIVTVGDESHDIIEGLPALNPVTRNFDSNALDATDAAPEICRALHHRFLSRLVFPEAKNSASREKAGPDAEFQFLEKTPKNALRIPFLKAMYPGAKFIFLYREPRGNISSIMEAWRSGRFVTYPRLPGWTGLSWSLLLIPGWRELIDAPLAQVAFRQWKEANEAILRSLRMLPESDWITTSYDELLEDAAGATAKLCQFAGVPFDDVMKTATSRPLPNSKYTLSSPSPTKWKKNENEIASFIYDINKIYDRIACLHRGG